MTFDAFGLSEPLLQAVAEKGYTTPSPIQLEAIPAVLTGRDVMAAAQTGTGKTAGFTLPILQLLKDGKKTKANHARVLILTPTRELAAQIGESIKTYGRYLPLSSTVVFGGVKINPQMMKLRKGVDILVATPGRLLDLYQQNAVRFDALEILVLDEADRMLDMGFIHDIRKIIATLPKKRQNLMFSATFADEIRKLTNLDIEQLPQVVNFDLPNVAEDYVHRIGRTGRAGSSGKAYSLVSADEIKQLNGIEQLIQKHITREYIDGFEPDHEVPASGPLKKSHIAKRANKPGSSRHHKQHAGNHTARRKGSDGHHRPSRRKRPANKGGNRSTKARPSGNR
ncbi:UNVERIFIED_CONTAM: hypothetical protein GTU68_058256 [Idotea baltica]|nr:hypothetical protein [Idotea baltica]